MGSQHAEAALIHARCGGPVIALGRSLFCLFHRAEVPAWQVERWQWAALEPQRPPSMSRGPATGNRNAE